MLVGSVATACFIAACADIFGIHNAEVDASAGDGGGGDVVTDVPYDYKVYDAVDFDVNTAICGDGGVPFVDTDAAVWVSGTGGDSNQCGAQTSPCKTITQALANRAGRSVIYLDDSTFTEVVTLAQTGLTVQGGWVIGDAGWTAVCNNTGSIIQGPADGGSAAVEVNASNVTVRLVTVKSKQQGSQGLGPPPESVYAIRVVDSPNLVLDNVTLIAQNAGGGAPGTTPGQVVGCTTDGGNGQPGSQGLAGQAGTFSGSTFTVTTAGTGTPGSNGSYTPPGNGQCGSCNQGCP